MDAVFNDDVNQFSTYDTTVIDEIISMITDLTSQIVTLKSNDRYQTSDEVNAKLDYLRNDLVNITSPLNKEMSQFKDRLDEIGLEIQAIHQSIQSIKNEIGSNPTEVIEHPATIWEGIVDVKNNGPDFNNGLITVTHPAENIPTAELEVVYRELLTAKLPFIALPEINENTLGEWSYTPLSIGNFAEYTTTYPGLDVLFQNVTMIAPVTPGTLDISGINELRNVLGMVSDTIQDSPQIATFKILDTSTSWTWAFSQILNNLKSTNSHKAIVNNILTNGLIADMMPLLQWTTIDVKWIDPTSVNDALNHLRGAFLGDQNNSLSNFENVYQNSMKVIYNTIFTYLTGPITSMFGRISLPIGDKEPRQTNDLEKQSSLDHTTYQPRLTRMRVEWTYNYNGKDASGIQSEYKMAPTDDHYTTGSMGWLNWFGLAFSRVPFWDTIRLTDVMQTKVPGRSYYGDGYKVHTPKKAARAHTDGVWIYFQNEDGTVIIFPSAYVDFYDPNAANTNLFSNSTDEYAKYNGSGRDYVDSKYSALSMMDLTHPYLSSFCDLMERQRTEWIQAAPPPSPTEGNINDITSTVEWMKKLELVIPNYCTHEALTEYLMKLSMVYRYLTCSWPDDSTLSSAYRPFMQPWPEPEAKEDWIHGLDDYPYFLSQISEMTRAIVDYFPQFNASVSEMVESLIGSMYSYGAGLDQRLRVSLGGSDYIHKTKLGFPMTGGRNDDFLPKKITAIYKPRYGVDIPAHWRVVNLPWMNIEIDPRFLSENGVPICPTDNVRLNLKPLPYGTCNLSNLIPYWWLEGKSAPLLLSGDWQSNPIVPFRDYVPNDSGEKVRAIFWMAGEFMLQTVAQFVLPIAGPLIVRTLTQVGNKPITTYTPNPKITNLIRDHPPASIPNIYSPPPELMGLKYVDFDLYNKLGDKAFNFPTTKIKLIELDNISMTQSEGKKEKETFLERINRLKKLNKELNRV